LTTANNFARFDLEIRKVEPCEFWFFGSNWVIQFYLHLLDDYRACAGRRVAPRVGGYVVDGVGCNA